jgi:hypothetical protein
LYPTCWDGVDLDSPVHKSHVAYPKVGAASSSGTSIGGDCPAMHPIQTPQVMLEVCHLFDPSSRRCADIYTDRDTRCFNNKADWPADGSQPFVLFTGDNTGYALSDEALDGLLTIRSYGQHGDYVFGWKDTSLQKAMDEALGCMGASCGGLETQQLDDGNKCTVKRRVTEDHDGWMVSLPGMDGVPM